MTWVASLQCLHSLEPSGACLVYDSTATYCKRTEGAPAADPFKKHDAFVLCYGLVHCATAYAQMDRWMLT